MREAILGLLTNDGVLRHILIGGIYQHTPITPAFTPLAFDPDCWLKPCCIVRWGTITSESRLRTRGLQNVTLEEVCFFFYEDARLCNGVFRPGYGAIEQARVRVRDLLHNRTLAPAQQAVGAVYGQVVAPGAYSRPASSWQIRHESDSPEFYDAELAGQRTGDRAGSLDFTELIARCTRSCYVVRVRGGGCC
jgi:hypothetical protein